MDDCLLRAVLTVSRRLGLRDQVSALAGFAASWSGLEVQHGFVLGENARRLVPVTAPEDNSESGVHLDLAEVSRHLRGRTEAVFDGAPSFAGDIIGDSFRTTWALAVRGSKDHIVGLILVAGQKSPDPGTRERVRGLLEEARPSVDNALEVRAIRALVLQDDTAKCFNRRYFEEFLAEEIARASRFRSPLSLIFFDMDNLKQINTRLGHAMGSRTLLEVSERVRNRIRKFDKLFRFGGDEFCVVLPETEWHGALEVAERVRESIAKKKLLLEVTAEGASMTASFGIASFPLHARTQAELIERADRAMQRVKNATKNSIGIAEIVKADSS